MVSKKIRVAFPRTCGNHRHLVPINKGKTSWVFAKTEDAGYTFAMDTRKFDPLNQLDAASEAFSGKWEQPESKRPLLRQIRRAIGWASLPVFLGFTAWMLGSLLGVWPEQGSAYSWLWIAAWAGGLTGCAGMAWGLRD